MLFDDQYKTIAHESSGEFKDRGSTFLGYAFPVTDEAGVKELIHKIKKDHPKANHHCYAFRIGVNGEASRFSDDREPSGTAGKPIFNVIRSHDLTNILIIVVRYFGGSLLGVPGLINAYRGAAANAVLNGKIISRTITEKYKIIFGYGEMKEISDLLRIGEADITSRKTEENCEIIFEISKSHADALLAKIRNHHLLKGKIKIETL